MPLNISNQTVDDGSVNIPILRFQLQSNTDSAQVSELSLQALGTGNDASDIDAVVLWVDDNNDGSVDAGDTEIGSGLYQADNGDLQLQLTVPYLLPLGSTDFIVTYDF